MVYIWITLICIMAIQAVMIRYLFRALEILRVHHSVMQTQIRCIDVLTKFIAAGEHGKNNQHG